MSVEIPGDIRAAEAARRAVGCFESRLGSDLFETVSLLVNELVTNALLHACMEGDPILLDVTLGRGGVLRAVVTDPGSGFEAPSADPPLEATSGRGLFLVDQLADRWGTEATPRTQVWFEIETAKASADQA